LAFGNEELRMKSEEFWYALLRNAFIYLFAPVAAGLVVQGMDRYA